MKTIDYNAEDVAFVFEDTKATEVLITADGHIFGSDNASRSYCQDHCTRTGITYRELTKGEFLVDQTKKAIAEGSATTGTDSVSLEGKSQPELLAMAKELDEKFKVITGEYFADDLKIVQKTKVALIPLIEARTAALAELIKDKDQDPGKESGEGDGSGDYKPVNVPGEDPSGDTQKGAAEPGKES